MDQTKDLQIMLEMIPCPAFAVRDGKIFHCNREAVSCQLEPGMTIEDLLISGQDEYATLKDACLYLQLRTTDRTWGASVTRLNELYLFRLEPEGVPAEVKAMELLCAELRYPVSSLSMLADRLLPQAANSNDAAAANHELNRILRILNNVSNAANFLSDAPATMEVRDICAVISEILEEAAAALEHADIHLRYTLPDERIYSAVNTQAVKQALYNLLDNAAKFTPESGEITADLVKTGKLLQLRVCDQGEGIPTELRSGIFSRYTQQPGFREGRENLGLGLALVRAAAQMHGGTVLVDAPEGIGTRVTMTMKIQGESDGVLRAPNAMRVVTSADNAMVMLSNVLPTSAYDPTK